MQARDDRIDEDEFEQNFAWDGRYRTLLVEPDVAAAEAPQADMALLRQLAVEGNIKAQIGWARALVEGAGVEVDTEAGFRWFNIAARYGDAEASNMVGRCYELGVGVQPRPDEAAYWYRRAAESGDAWGQFNLATLLAQGRGVIQDIPAAVSWLVKSARQGNAKAMNMLGRVREDGVMSGPRPRSARAWYRRAASRGCFRGQFHFARHLACEGHEAEARRWLRSSMGHAPADFCRGAAAALREHSDARVRRLISELPASIAEPA